MFDIILIRSIPSTATLKMVVKKLSDNLELVRQVSRIAMKSDLRAHEEWNNVNLLIQSINKG